MNILQISAKEIIKDKLHRIEMIIKKNRGAIKELECEIARDLNNDKIENGVSGYTAKEMAWLEGYVEGLKHSYDLVKEIDKKIN